MSVSIFTKEKDIADIGYGEFRKFRIIVAEAFDKEYAQLYKQISTDSSQNKIIDEKINNLIKKKQYMQDDNKYVIEFLHQPDCDGKISPEACKKIYDVLKNVKSNETFGYLYEISLNDIKNELLNCYNKQLDFQWC